MADEIKKRLVVDPDVPESQQTTVLLKGWGDGGGGEGDFPLADRMDKGTGDKSVKVGNLAQLEATNKYAVAMGNQAKAAGVSSLAMGNTAEALGDFSTSIGDGTLVSAGAYAGHAEGRGTQVQAAQGHAEGYSTLVDYQGECGHAEGKMSRVYASAGHAEGTNAVVGASGRSGHAEGTNTQALTENSHAEGNGTQTSGSKEQHVQGRYNVATEAGGVKLADIVGGGEGPDARRNIEATTWDGDKYLAGDVYVHANDDSTEGTLLRPLPELSVEDKGKILAINQTGDDIEWVEGSFPLADRIAKGNGNQSVVIGDITSAADILGNQTLGIGGNNKIDSYSTATITTGRGNEVKGEDTAVLGRNNTVDGHTAFVAGRNNTITSNAGVALGSDHQATAESAVAIGARNTVNGNGAVAVGSSITALGAQQVVVGCNNVPDAANEYEFIVGGGQLYGDQKNLSAITRTGDTKVSGDIYVRCNDDSSGGIMLEPVPGLDPDGADAGKVLVVNNDGDGLEWVMNGADFPLADRLAKGSSDYSIVGGVISTNQATNDGAMALGWGPKATAVGAFAANLYTMANGQASFAEGNRANARAEASHAEGVFTKTGTSTQAMGQHVQGKYNSLDGVDNFADVVGGGTSETLRANIEATNWQGDKYLKGDVYVHCEDNSTGGTRLEPFPTHTAGQQGKVLTVGASGVLTWADGGGGGSFPLSDRLASGEHWICSVKGGNINSNYVNGQSAFGFGDSVRVEGDYAVALGKSAQAIGECSLAVGQESVARGYGSVALGQSEAHDVGAFAVGFGTSAWTSGSCALGVETEAGDQQRPECQSAFAEGYQTKAKGFCSHAEGQGTIAYDTCQHVQGKYNVSENYLNLVDIIGWGANKYNPENIYAVDTDGNVRIKGDVYVGCLGDSTGGTKLEPGGGGGGDTWDDSFDDERIPEDKRNVKDVLKIILDELDGLSNLINGNRN